MLDSITAIVTCFQENPIDSGLITKINSSGDIELESITSITVDGSHY